MDKNTNQQEILKEMLRKEQRKVSNYNKKLDETNKSINFIHEEFEKKEYLKSISWQLFEIDREAVEDFRRNHDCSYNDIIKYALRYYLSEINYRHAQEIIELKKKHDDEVE